MHIYCSIYIAHKKTKNERNQPLEMHKTLLRQLPEFMGQLIRFYPRISNLVCSFPTFSWGDEVHHAYRLVSQYPAGQRKCLLLNVS